MIVSANSTLDLLSSASVPWTASLRFLSAVCDSCEYTQDTDYLSFNSLPHPTPPPPPLGNFSWLIFFKIKFFEKFFQEYHQSVKQFAEVQISFQFNWVFTPLDFYELLFSKINCLKIFFNPLRFLKLLIYK